MWQLMRHLVIRNREYFAKHQRKKERKKDRQTDKQKVEELLGYKQNNVFPPHFTQKERYVLKRRAQSYQLMGKSLLSFLNQVCRIIEVSCSCSLSNHLLDYC